MASTVPQMGQLAPTDIPVQVPSPGENALGEQLVCQWQGCTAPNHPSAEALYDHVCEQHIGRKSTNNLNLQCFWGSCRTTTVKRDHITSHIRVHVPLKPHKCDFCGKSFKRPQDLKKHVKTHADESVLFNSPQNNTTNPQQAPNGYQAPANGKADGSYDVSHGQHLNYPYGGSNGPYNGGNGMPAGNFAPLYGYNPQSSYGGPALTESRKRTHDALNDFFGDVKRRNLDGGQYQDLGARFNQFLNWFAPTSAGGWNNGYNPGYAGGGFDNGGGIAFQTQHAPPMGPFHELRTKGDLLTIDQFLEQLQHTVYDNPVEGANAGYQPVAGMQHAGFQLPRRSSNSPPRFQNGLNAALTPGSYSVNSFAQSSNVDDTPALTPSSFQTSHSPKSNLNISPNSRPLGESLYPTLPSFSSIDPGANAFGGGPSNTLPPSGLGPQYEDFDGRRRYSGGFLQRARQSTPVQEAHEGLEKDLADGIKKENEATEAAKEGKMSDSPELQHVKLPSVSEITRDSEDEQKEPEESKLDAKQDDWSTNLRTIGMLREYIKHRLQRNEFEVEEEDVGNRTPRPQQDVEMKEDDTFGGEEGREEKELTPRREGASLYPVLRAVEA